MGLPDPICNRKLSHASTFPVLTMLQQWIFIPPILIGVIFAPESPWWLVRNDYFDEAAVVIKRLMSKEERMDENNVQIKLSEMKLTNEHEKALSAGTSYLDCFKGIDLRRTEVACLTWCAQNMSGSALMGCKYLVVAVPLL